MAKQIVTDLFGTRIKQPPKPWSFEGEPALRILSLGAGVQSSTLVYMILEGMLPRPDALIFADTGWEPREVYTHLERLRAMCEIAMLPLHVVTAGNIRDDALRVKWGNYRFASMPVFSANMDGSQGRQRRQCTREYKIAPITRKIRELLGVDPGKRVPRSVWVEQWVGISLDEIERTRTRGYVPWSKLCYPLIEMKLKRSDCLAWIAQRGYPTPPKSSCIGCPFHDNAFWQRMKDETPDEFEDAADFDRQIRNGLRGVNMPAYLHRSLIPLSEVSFEPKPEREGPMQGLFSEECSGMCGV